MVREDSESPPTSPEDGFPNEGSLWNKYLLGIYLSSYFG